MSVTPPNSYQRPQTPNRNWVKVWKDDEADGTTINSSNVSTAPHDFEPLRLLVMQATPFCNLDCQYCYLPSRNLAKQMSAETVDAVFTDLLTAPFLGRKLTVVWHAGEPL